MKKTIISLVVLSVISGSTYAGKMSHSFDRAVNTRSTAKDAERAAIADYNSPDRFNADGSFNQSVSEAADTATQQRRDAENAVNGTNYRNQVAAQQADQKIGQTHQATIDQAAADAMAKSRRAAANDARVKRADSAVKQDTAVRAGKALVQSNYARTEQQAVALADARQAEADRQAKSIANYGVKNDPTGKPTNQQSPETGKSLTKANYARTEQQAVALADARQAEADRQDKTRGKATHQTNEMHEQPLHQSATAMPAVNRATRLDSSAADQSAAAQAQADAQAQHAKDIANYGVKRAGTATYNEQPHTVTYSGVTMRPNTGTTINVAANTLKPDTRVQVTDKTGHKSVVKASTLTPSTQVSVPFHSAFQHVGKGGNSHEKSTSHVDHGTGTGADNAHDHAFGGHDGAGGGFHM